MKPDYGSAANPKGSLTVDPQRNRFRCWRCGVMGDDIAWLILMKKMDMAEALEHLAQRAEKANENKE